MSDDRRDSPAESETAMDEVLREVSEAQQRTGDTADPARRHRRTGEAADAITPNTRAQEESEGD
ncbi:hypothetical protein ACFVOK_37620 [Streptomyces sp. NPDC057798]|uniref:hypothetical protein n=1 Tax=Streptomyces sp. NPDC057798 TaxID=3346252 RepID=UPI0036BDB58B